MHSPPRIEPERWLDEHGDILYRYALARIRDPQTAEDLVQDTFLAALKGLERFAGRSSERTWLISILKHKLIDHCRRQGRVLLCEDLELREPDPHDPMDPGGHWRSGPAPWLTHPEKACERQEFWGHLNHCLDNLKERHRTVFVLRELQHQDTEALCRSLDLTPSHLWVILHRARLQLRDCLRARGLSREPAP